MKKQSTSSAVFGIVAVLLPLLYTAHPTSAHAADTIDISAKVSPEPSRRSEYVILKVNLSVPRGYHLYSMTRIEEGPLPLSIKIEDDHLVEESEWFGPTPQAEYDKNFKKNVEFHEGKVTYSRAFKNGDKSPDSRNIEINVRGQLCDEEKCIPFRRTLTVALTIAEGSIREAYASPTKLEGEPFPPDRRPRATAQSGEGIGQPTDKGLLGFLILAFIAGLGALFTPCVFPMIPITVSFFAKYAEVSMKRAAMMAAMYSISIIFTYTALGLLISAIFGAVGMQVLSSSPWFNLFLVILLLVFALNLFGLFEIQLPSWLVSRSSAKEQALTGEEGSLARQFAGVFFMALTFTMVSFTCTAGFMGWVLAEASRGEVFYPAVGMLVFSSAFAIPFFFLALFPSVANNLGSRAGDWMVAIKVLLGFFLIIGAFKFLSNVDLVWQLHLLSRPMVLSIWTGVFFVAGLFLLRVFNLPHSDTENPVVGPTRMIVAMLMFAMAAYSASGIQSTRSMGGWLDGWLPHAVPDNELADDDSGQLTWILNDLEKGMAEAKAQNMPLFIDFSGYTCTNCRYMEGSVFPRPKVRAELVKMVRVQANTDGSGEVSRQLQEYQLRRFKTVALPYYAIINPHDDSVISEFAGMTNDIDKFVDFLKSAVDKFNALKAGQNNSSDVSTEVEKEDGGDPGEIVLVSAGEEVDFQFPDLYGGAKHSLKELRGDWVFLNFWASWCVPCRKELKEDFPPMLRAFPKIKLVTVAFDGESTRKQALKILDDAGVPKHIALLGGDDITEAGLSDTFEVSESLPISYLIHPDGHIAWMRKGSVNKELLEKVFSETQH